MSAHEIIDVILGVMSGFFAVNWFFQRKVEIKLRERLEATSRMIATYTEAIAERNWSLDQRNAEIQYLRQRVRDAEGSEGLLSIIPKARTKAERRAAEMEQVPSQVDPDRAKRLMERTLKHRMETP